MKNTADTTFTFSVQFAVYGALNGGNQDSAQTMNVATTLLTQLNAGQGIVTITNSSMGNDPSPGNTKHFAAVVSVNGGAAEYFACQEGQQIDFLHTQPPSNTPPQTPVTPTIPLTVVTAVYGALNGGNENNSQAVNVTAQLQGAINNSQGVVNIDNTTMGGDPSTGNTKHFGAVVQLCNSSFTNYFACQEGQTIDFFHTMAVASSSPC